MTAILAAAMKPRRFKRVITEEGVTTLRCFFEWGFHYGDVRQSLSLMEEGHFEEPTRAAVRVAY